MSASVCVNSFVASCGSSASAGVYFFSLSVQFV